MGGEAALELRGVTRVVDGVEILRGIDLVVPRGRVALILGPNGAGKSTILRCVVGVIRCGGSIRVEGVDVAERPVEARRVIGYAPQQPSFPRGVRVIDVVRLHARLYGVEIDEDELLRFFGLGDLRGAVVDRLSGGQRQRLSLALAFAHAPRLVLLDEPFNNLDEDGRKLLIDVITRMRGSSTIVMVTHPVPGVEDLADMRVFVDGGVVRWVR